MSDRDVERRADAWLRFALGSCPLALWDPERRETDLWARADAMLAEYDKRFAERFPAPEAAPAIEIDNVCHPEEIRRAYAVGRTEAFERAAKICEMRAIRSDNCEQSAIVAHGLAAEIRKEAGVGPTASEKVAEVADSLKAASREIVGEGWEQYVKDKCAETRRKALQDVLEASAATPVGTQWPEMYTIIRAMLNESGGER